MKNKPQTTLRAASNSRPTFIPNTVEFKPSFFAATTADGITLSYKPVAIRSIQMAPVLGEETWPLDGGCKLLDVAGSALVCFWWAWADEVVMCLVDRQDPNLWELLMACRGSRLVHIHLALGKGGKQAASLSIATPFDLMADVQAYPYRPQVDVCKHVLNKVSITQLVRMGRTMFGHANVTSVSVFSAVDGDAMRRLRPDRKLTAIDANRKKLVTKVVAELPKSRRRARTAARLDGALARGL